MQNERKIEFGLPSQEINDDNISLMEYRERRQEWNRIIDYRQNLAHQIFNTVDTKQLYKIDEPLNDDEEKEEEQEQRQEHRQRQNRTPERVRRRR